MHIYASVPDAFENCHISKTFSFIRLEEHPLSELFFSSDVYTVFYSDSVSFDLLIHNHAYHVSRDSVFIIRPFEFAHPIPCETETLTGYLLFVHPAYLKNLLQYHENWKSHFSSKEKDFLHLCLPSSAVLASLEHLFCQLLSPMEFGSNLYEHHACLEFLLSLCQCFQSAYEAKNAPEQYYTKHLISGLPLETILSFIDSNFTKDLTLDSFRNTFYISSSYLCRIFKNHIGITLNHYINARRISLARYYLSKGYNVSESFTHCGFHEYSTFLKSFRKHAGCSPTEFIRQNLNL